MCLAISEPPIRFFRFTGENRYCSRALLFHRNLSGKNFPIEAVAETPVTSRTLPSRIVHTSTRHLPSSVTPTERCRSSLSITS